MRDDCGGGDYSLRRPYTLLTMPATQAYLSMKILKMDLFISIMRWAMALIGQLIIHIIIHGIQCAHNAYNNTNTNILHETGVLDLSAAAVVFLEFWQIAKAEGDFDHC